VAPSCVLCCYSLLHAESVPFVLNFVQKAVRLLWDGLDMIVNPHESVGKELWKEVAPADLGEMAADLEMQKAFIGKKRPRSDSIQEQFHRENDRERIFFCPAQHDVNAPMTTPPMQGLSPAPLFPSTVQQISENAQQFVYRDRDQNGHWAVQQAVRSVGDLNLWTNNNGVNASLIGGSFAAGLVHQQQNRQSHSGYQMAFVDYADQSVVAQMDHVDHYPSNGPVKPTPVNNLYSALHVDDPDTIRANLLEFNAMAQQYHSTAANATESVQHQALHLQLANLDQMHLLPLPQSEVPDMLTGSQQSILCTTTAQPLSVASMDRGASPALRICRIEGCGLPVSKGPYCGQHCGNRQCEKEGCNKCAQGATRFCIAHGGGRRCTFPGCDKGARDKFFCAA